jgi:uncharacterized protein YjiS (DUF1127 family)
MLAGGAGTARHVAIEAFVSVIERERLAASISYGFAKAAAREVDRASAALYQATERRVQLGRMATTDERIAAELEVDRWRQYIATHTALALQGALLVFNSIDLALKDYARIRYGPAPTWIRAGPAFGPTPRTLFEIIRAICNYFRHRDEWLALGTPTNPSMAILRDLGINPLSSTAYIPVLQLIPFDTWLELESAIVGVIAALV